MVEDGCSILELVTARLEHEGFEIVGARDGEEGVKCATDDGGIDLVLLDLKLPKLDGYQVCRRLKAQSATAKIPIIIMTGTETYLADLADRCIELGVQGWLKKPLESKELLGTIRRALNEEVT